MLYFITFRSNKSNMYTTRKNPIFKSQPSLILKAKRENFKPQAEWKEDQYNHMLLVQLPGFKREEIRVQLDNAGKLFVKGSRLAADNKYIDVDQSFDVPKDVITDKISGKFEDGHLSLIMPKSVITKAEAVAKGDTVMNEATKELKSKHEATKEEQPRQEERHEQGKLSKEKKDESTREEKTRSNDANQMEKPTVTEAMASFVKDAKSRITKATPKEPTQEKEMEEKTRSNDANQMEKPTVTEAMASFVKDAKSRITKATHKEPTQEKEKEFAGTDTKENGLNSKLKAEEMPKGNFYSDNNKHEEVENRKAKTEEGIMRQEEKKVEQAIEEIKGEYNGKVKAISSEAKREKGKIKGTMQKMKLKVNEIYRDTPKDIKKKIDKMRQGEDGWLNSKYADGAMEKINRNRNIIAVAVLAFSIGLYVSQKLKAKNG